MKGYYSKDQGPKIGLRPEQEIDVTCLLLTPLPPRVLSLN